MSRSELLDHIFRHAAVAPDRLAFVEVGSGRSLTYRQLASRVRVLSAALEPRPPDRRVVMLRCGNRFEYPVWFLALLACGAGVAPTSVELTSPELRQAAERIGATAVVAATDDPARDALHTLAGDVWPLDLALTVGDGPPPAAGAPGDLLLASSGTTGAPKVVRRSSQSLDAVSRNMVEAVGLRADDRVLAVVPLTHSYGLEHGLLAPLWAGCTVDLCPGLDLPLVARALAGGASVFPAVPSMIEAMAALADPAPSMPRLRMVYSAGGPLPPAVAGRFERRFGVRVGQVYGMTEIGSVTFNAPAAEPFRPESVGRAMRDVSIRVLDVRTPHAPVAAGDEGEVAVRAPSMFDGYLGARQTASGDPSEPGRAAPSGPKARSDRQIVWDASRAGDDAALVDGHFRTGDLGRLDAAGNLTLTGRVRLLIDTGGMKVNPAEVEAVIAAHPGVLECVVLPVRQTETVQRLRVVVVPRDPADPPAGEDVRRFARARLAGYKVPRLVEFAPSLPRTAAGKVRRQLLEET